MTGVNARLRGEALASPRGLFTLPKKNPREAGAVNDSFVGSGSRARARPRDASLDDTTCHTPPNASSSARRLLFPNFCPAFFQQKIALPGLFNLLAELVQRVLLVFTIVATLAVQKIKVLGMFGVRRG